MWLSRSCHVGDGKIGLKPDCAARPSDCADVDVLNRLDGFNIQPRISIPFSAPIDLSTVSSRTIFLVGPKWNVIGINQVEWEPLANTLHFESDEQLAEDTTYLLVVSRGVHGADGKPLDNTRFFHDLAFGQTHDAHVKGYRHDLIGSLVRAAAGSVNPSQIADASLFTTQSVDVTSRKIRAQLRGGPTNFDLGTGGERDRRLQRAARIEAGADAAREPRAALQRVGMIERAVAAEHLRAIAGPGGLGSAEI